MVSSVAKFNRVSALFHFFRSTFRSLRAQVSYAVISVLVIAISVGALLAATALLVHSGVSEPLPITTEMLAAVTGNVSTHARQIRCGNEASSRRAAISSANLVAAASESLTTREPTTSQGGMGGPSAQPRGALGEQRRQPP